MTPALALAGWAAAIVSGLGVLLARRALISRMELVARACHELRGPITATRLGLELAGRPGALSPASLRALDLELGRAALAIDDLAELPSGRCAPGRWEEVELRGLLADSVEAWRPTAGARGVALRFCRSGAPAIVLGNRLRLAQATGNLLANAIEHGGGVVEVRVMAAEPWTLSPEGWDSESKVRSIRIEFSDSGPGLPAPVAELMRRGRRRRGPHGHGLVVAAEVAAAHGGRLAAAPSERGARLVLELPLVAVAVAKDLTAPPSPGDRR
jgi:signal transduction histidine kinase